MTLKVLLADDEPLALERLRGFLQAEPGITILGECGDGLQALEAIRARKPDLLFLDIQMPELDGFEVLEALDPAQLPVVVFASAYDRYALRAFQARALDYLLKPFSRERFREALRRAEGIIAGARALEHQQELDALLKAVADRPRQAERLLVRAGERLLIIPAPEVEAIEAEANYMWVHRDTEAYPMRGTLAALEQRLGPLGFFRTHRSWMLNPRHLRELNPGAGGGLVAITQGGTRVPVSASQRKALEALLPV